MKFKVIDRKTGREADTWNIALHEEWAQDLVYCDMEGFAITEDGDLVLMDECGHVVYCDTERFKVVFEDEQPSLSTAELPSCVLDEEASNALMDIILKGVDIDDTPIGGFHDD